MQSSYISIIIDSYLFINHHSILAIPNTVYTVVADICGCGQKSVAFSNHYYLRYADYCGSCSPVFHQPVVLAIFSSVAHHQHSIIQSSSAAGRLIIDTFANQSISEMDRQSVYQQSISYYY